MDRSAGPDACWPWLGYCNERSGHGRIRVAGKLVLTHRLARELVHGPTALCVLHTCDNPPCVNPAHLWVGTVLDNNCDRDAKGRNVNRRGSEHGNARLTEDSVRTIRARAARGESTSSLARAYGVARGTINFAVARKTWAHV